MIFSLTTKIGEKADPVIAGSAFFFVWGIEREAVSGPARKGRRVPAALEDVVGCRVGSTGGTSPAPTKVEWGQKLLEWGWKLLG